MKESLASLKNNRLALAKALTQIESDFTSPATQTLLEAAYKSDFKSHVIGLTGTPGVGKSTLVGALVAKLRNPASSQPKRKVAIIAVDPSSSISQGSILGDRLRFNLNADDEGTFARSVASGGALGGLAAPVMPFICLLRALFEVVIVETVGIGQSEDEITHLSDTTVLCLQPAAGDSIQYMKAGIMELPHILCLNKADLPQAAASKTSLISAVAHFRDPPPVVSVSSVSNEGLDELIQALDERLAQADIATIRRQGGQTWLRAQLKERFGTVGMEQKLQTLKANENPFTQLAKLWS